MLGPGNELSPPPHCARLSAFHHFQSIKQPAARESCRWVTSQHLTSFRRWGKGKKSTFLIGDINNAEEEIKLKGFSFPKWTCRMWLPSWAAVRRSSSGSQGGNSERVTLRREVLCRVGDTADPAVRMHCSPQEQGRCGRSFTVLPEALGVTTNQRGQTLGVHPGGKAPHLQRSSPRSRKAAEAPLLPRASQTAFSILCPLGGIQEDCSSALSSQLSLHTRKSKRNQEPQLPSKLTEPATSPLARTKGPMPSCLWLFAQSGAEGRHYMETFQGFPGLP